MHWSRIPGVRGRPASNVVSVSSVARRGASRPVGHGGRDQGFLSHVTIFSCAFFSVRLILSVFLQCKLRCRGLDVAMDQVIRKLDMIGKKCIGLGGAYSSGALFGWLTWLDLVETFILTSVLRLVLRTIVEQ